MPDTVDAIDQQSAPVVAESPSSGQDRTVDTIDDGEIPSGGGQWDGEKNKFVNPVRQGRFAKVRASLEEAQKTSEYKRAVIDGFVDPDETMDPETWAMARNAQIRSKTGQITPPNFSEVKSGADATVAEQPATAQKTLTPEEIKHVETHTALMGNIAAKLAIDPELQTARAGFQSAMASGAVPEQAVGYLGHVLADVDNPHEVLIALGKNPDVLQMYSNLGPVGMKSAVVALSRELLAKNSVKAVAPKPKPPDPVGARATATFFDVHDDSLDGDEWLRQRQKQVNNQRAAGR